MNLLRLSNQVVDMDEVSGREISATALVLTFNNGDKIHIPWRDALEKNQMLAVLQSVGSP
jgi:hypothetical protein